MNMSTPNLPAVIFRHADLAANYRAVRARLRGPVVREAKRPSARVEPSARAPSRRPQQIVIAPTLEGRTLAAIETFEQLSAAYPWMNGAVRARMAVMRAFNIPSQDLCGSSRLDCHVEPRQVAMAIAFHIGRRTLPDIGLHFGGRDHTTVIHATTKREALVKGVLVWRERFGRWLPALPKPKGNRMGGAIPEAVLTQHTAVLGKTGSGKTSTGKLAIEQVVAEGSRVCVLDPAKSDWWGLTSSADGKRPGLPFVILGGPHGHVPLHASAGKSIGELVARGELPLSIIDMADFEPGGLQRFFTEFAPVLMRKMRGVLYLVIEEAHEFAPKERSGIGAENMAIHWAKKLATAGRSKGIRLILLTQRVQALHNALLGSCDTMIVHRLTAPADQEPVKKWLKANVAKDVLDQVESSLSSLKTGTGWICSGEARVFERVPFPRIATYDNTATPTHDSGDHQVTTAPVDRDRLRAIIGEAVQEAEANDPVKLKAEIARLQNDIARAGAAPRVDPSQLQAAEQRGYQRGFDEAFARGIATVAHFWTETIPLVARMKSAFEEFERLHDMVFNNIEGRAEGAPLLLDVPSDQWDKVTGKWEDIKKRIGSGSPPVSLSPDAPPMQAHLASVQPAKPSPAASGDGTLTPALQKCLDAIAWWRKIGIEPVPRSRACVVAGFSPKASTFGVYIADLVKRGLVEVSPGMVRLTADGIAAARTPDAATAHELYRMARDLLGHKEQAIFDIVYGAYPNAIARKKVAEAAGLSPTASTCGVYLAAIAAYGIIENAGAGTVRAADWLFPR